MPQRRRLAPLLLLLAAILLSGCGTAVPPRATDGIIDLSHWDFRTEGVARLNGEWAFYWQKLLSPTDFDREEDLPPAKYLPVPGVWNGYRLDGEPVGADGYATFHIRVRLKQPGVEHALFVRHISTAYRLYIDGQLVATNGVVAAAASQAGPKSRTMVARFTPRQESVDLVVQVSNYHHRVGGIRYPIEIGLADQMETVRLRSIATTLFLVVSIATMGAYHLGLSRIRQHDRPLLFFGLMCLTIAVRGLAQGDLLLSALWPGLRWEWHIRIEYLTGYAALAMLYLYLGGLYPGLGTRRPVQVVVAITGLLSIITLVTPPRFSSTLIPGYEIMTAIAILYALVPGYRALVGGREGAALFLGGYAALVVAMLHDLLSYNQLFFSRQILPLGQFIMVIAQSTVLARQYAAAFQQQADLAAELQRSRRLLTAREEQMRKEIAELLHGRVQTRLLMIWHRLATAVRLWGQEPAQALEFCQAAMADLDQVRTEEVREASHLLHPSIIQVGLTPAVRSLLARFHGRFEAVLEVDPALPALDDSVSPAIPEPIRLTAYRVLEEALANVVMHAHASEVRVHLGLKPEGHLVLVLEDDGRGIDLATLKQGLGLRAIAARVAEAGGQWQIAGREGGGTTFWVRLPLQMGE